MKINYELKSEILQHHGATLLLENQLRKKVFYDDTSERLEYTALYSSAMQDHIFSECHKINRAYAYRVKRLRDRIYNILEQNKQCVFLTLTFTDEVLNKTTKETRRRYVVRFLGDISSKYVANIDYGAKDHREHYHAVVAAAKVDGNEWRKKCGSINFEKINYAPQYKIDVSHIEWWNPKALNSYIAKNEDKTAAKLSKYVAKLTNHAIKETTKRSAVIYSR